MQVFDQGLNVIKEEHVSLEEKEIVKKEGWITLAEMSATIHSLVLSLH